MNSHCEREPQIVSAVLAGTLSREISAHVQICPFCSEILQVANQLRDGIVVSDDELGCLPDPILIWQRAQTRARAQALARATWPIRMMGICASILALLGLPWLALHMSPPAWISNLGVSRLFSADGPWLSALTGTTLFGIGATFASIGLGSWYMLREK
jgi:predicted anti-sigma-YlaC factor YlaD